MVAPGSVAKMCSKYRDVWDLIISLRKELEKQLALVIYIDIRTRCRRETPHAHYRITELVAVVKGLIVSLSYLL